MSDQFISAITDEAMARICYDGGWGLKPYKFLDCFLYRKYNINASKIDNAAIGIL